MSDAGINGISTIILRVSDLAGSTEFYRDRVGLKLAMAFPGFAFFEAGGLRLALNENKETAGQDRGLTEIVFDCGDVVATFSALSAAGVSFTREPRVVSADATHELLATDFRDPDGHVLSIVGRRIREQ